MAWDKKTIGINISCDNTTENKEVIQKFMDFCKLETQGNYTMGLKLLLDSWYRDFKLELINARISRLEGDVESFKVGVDDESPSPNTF